MKILITGDFCPINRASDAFQRDIFPGLDQLNFDSDLNITNLECPFTENDDPINKTGPTLKAMPQQVKFLKKKKFNLVTLANNHIMDYGSKGLKDTIEILEKNKISYVGAGNSDHIDVIHKTVEDFKVAIINICENEWSTREREGYKANGFSEIEAFYSIKKAIEKADKVIVIHHGGHEMYNLPSPRLKKTLRFFVDCGAHVVINHHTHCISGYEIYNNAPILYSLGNFVFDHPEERDSIWNYGMLVIFTLTKEKIDFHLHYFEQFNKDDSLKFIDEEELLYKIEELNSIIQDDELLEQKFEIFVEKKRKMYNSYLEPIKSRYYIALKNRGFLPSLWNSKKRSYLNNLITCESHQEIVKQILKNET